MTVFFFFYVEIYVSHVVQILKRAFRICVRTGISGRIYKVIIFFFVQLIRNECGTNLFST